MDIQTKLINFLKEELGIPNNSIKLALGHPEQSDYSPRLLPMFLWKYGLITLSQLERVLDWLETV